MTDTNFAETWKDEYSKYEGVINFSAGDYDSFVNAIRLYLTQYSPETINDWMQSSEQSLFTNALAYIGESEQYRIDLNYHDLFPSTTTRKDSLLNFSKLLSYSAKRNICANGIAKLVSVSTTQNIADSVGKSLTNVTVEWNDSSNENWLEQFLTIMNSAFSYNNPYGKPLKTNTVEGISTQLYELNNTAISSSVLPFTSLVNTQSQGFEVVNPDIDLVNDTVFERVPDPNQAFHILYRNDGSGNTSENTGFFVYWKQGRLGSQVYKYSEKIENNSIEVPDKNINQSDVWFQEINVNDGKATVIENWTKINPSEYLSYNNVSSNVKTIYKVETRENDEITVRFSDGYFGDIPYGVYRLWYRVSNGNDNLFIKPKDINNISVKIPYKSNISNTDDNTYYLTLTFSVQNINHIRQCVPSETIETIKNNIPKIASTQNRMVSNSDYNYFPLSISQNVKYIQSNVRTYSGNSRYIDFNDPTGTYKNLNVVAEDGYVYSSDITSSISIDITNKNDIYTQIQKYVLPKLSSLSEKNLYYKYYPKEDIPFANKEDEYLYMWKQTSSMASSSYGYFGGIKYESGEYLYYNTIDYDTVLNVFAKNKLVKFGALDTNIPKTKFEYTKYEWAMVTNMTSSSDGTYVIALDKVLDPTKIWIPLYSYNAFTTDLSTNVLDRFINEFLDSESSFGLTFDSQTGTWKFIDTNGQIDGIDWSDNFKETDARLHTIEDTITALNWIIKVVYESNGYNLYIRTVDNIYGSVSETSFFFNTENKLLDGSFLTSDYIKLFSTNEGFNTDCYIKPFDTLKYTDGSEDNQRFICYGTEDSSTNNYNPREILDIIDENQDKLIFIKSKEDGKDILYSEVIDTKNMYSYTQNSGLYYVGNYGSIYKAGTQIPYTIKIPKGVQLSNGVVLYADLTIMPGQVCDYDVVDLNYYIPHTYNDGVYQFYDNDGNKITIQNTDINPTFVKDGNTYIASRDFPIKKNVLVSWNAKDYGDYIYGSDEYDVKYGKKNLRFLWKHYASSGYVIDPAISNIIDTYVLTTSYYDEVQKWISNGKEGSFPTAVSTYELKSMFASLDDYKMISDTIIWHPIIYKNIFGKSADEEYQVIFKAIKNTNSVVSDNELKKMIVSSIDEYFNSFSIGDNFYFTQLASYIHNKLGQYINTIVPVPVYGNEKFGNLFEIECPRDSILISSATIDDIKIINQITDYNIKIGA